MSEIEMSANDAEMRRIKAAAEQTGMTVEEFVTHAANVELARRYLLPKKRSQVLPFLPRKRKGGRHG